MFKTEIRLIDIFNSEQPFVDGLLEGTQTTLYEAVVNNYMWAYLEADTYEQFAVMFKRYWDRLIPVYQKLYEQQLKFLENINYFRKEKYHRKRVEIQTPDKQAETTYTLGDKTELQHGRVLTHNRELTDNSEDTSYNTQTVERMGTLGGTESNTYSGKDTTSRSGENVEVRKETGTDTNDHTDDSTTDVEMYDAERLAVGIRMANIIDKFIDEFSPLFVPVIF